MDAYDGFCSNIFQKDVLGISTARSLLQPAKFENICFLKMAYDMEKLKFALSMTRKVSVLLTCA